MGFIHQEVTSGVLGVMTRWMDGWGFHGMERMRGVRWDHLTPQDLQPPWDPQPPQDLPLFLHPWSPQEVWTLWDPQVPQDPAHTP